MHHSLVLKYMKRYNVFKIQCVCIVYPIWIYNQTLLFQPRLSHCFCLINATVGLLVQIHSETSRLVTRLPLWESEGVGLWGVGIMMFDCMCVTHTKTNLYMYKNIGLLDWSRE